MPSIHIVAFYRFTPIEASQLENLRAKLKEFGAQRDMKGLVLLAEEGVNGTVCGSLQAIEEWKQFMTKEFGVDRWNDSQAGKKVFPRWLVKVKQEIVTLKQPDVNPSGPNNHLSPEEFDAMLEAEDAIVIDTRNTYETKIGMFERAIDPKIEHFSHFADFVKESNIPKDRPVLMYCTSGIRCEKASIEMQKQGYTKVYQLHGGILNYIRRFPGKKFRGECFVFDHRVAVDQNLEPSKQYGLCTQCGNPGDEIITCDHCSKQARMCRSCLSQGCVPACSKNCRNTLISCNHSLQ